MSASRPWRFDPVLDVPKELADLCLSFLGVHSLLNDAQRVSHAWKDAVDGGLPTIWHHVLLRRLKDVPLADAQFAIVAQKSHGRIQSLKAESAYRISTQGLQHLRTCPNLRVLDIQLLPNVGCAISPVLPFLPLLEELVVWHSETVILPPLQFLGTLRCNGCKVVQGLRNVPALTKLEFQFYSCLADADDDWPTGLREVAINSYPVFHPVIVHRIAAMQQLIRLDTDWSFAHQPEHTLFSPPHNQLSFLQRITTLQHFSFSGSMQMAMHAFPFQAVFNHLGAMLSLRELELAHVRTDDQDLQCLAHLTSLESLRLYGLNTLTRVPPLHNLKRLCIRWCTSIQDYSSISVCSQLRELTIFPNAMGRHSGLVQAVTQLHYLEMFKWMHKDHDDMLAHLCNMRSLRALVVRKDYGLPIPASAFASLPNLTLLEKVCVAPVQNTSELVDCLVQMPRLKNIRFVCGRDIEIEDRLRNALPRLEIIKWMLSAG